MTLENYPGEWVAVHNDTVLAHSEDPMAVAAEVKKYREQGMAGISLASIMCREYGKTLNG